MVRNKTKKKAVILFVSAVLLLGGCGMEDLSEEEAERVEAEDLPAEKTERAETEELPAEKTEGAEAEDLPAKKAEEAETEDFSGEKAEGTKTEELAGVEIKKADAESARLQKYQEVLRDVLEKQVYPDGTDCGFDGYDPLAGNKFAVVDVDKDGKKELLLCITTTSMAGMREVVYDYDEKTDTVREEFSGFPGVSFYENGLIEEGFSHNQGMASMGDFWPYMLHRYQAQSDSYECIFVVDAWEKACRAEDYDGNPYPEEVDAENSGIVYFVMESGEYDMTSAAPVSKSTYEKWQKDQGLYSERMEIPYQALIEKNIENIIALVQF